MRTLRAGPIGARKVYRVIRRWWREAGDVYMSVRWPAPVGRWPVPEGWTVLDDLPDAVADAVVDLDRVCKTIDWGPGRLEVRTRCWGRRAWADRPKQYHPPQRLPGRGTWRRRYRETADRANGLEYARRIAAVLRAAHAHGVDLTICSDSGV